jgi:3-deoxy-D-manno-octulosonate 8-phosphate phosphatase (KDO 8-P phosphatase)
MDFANIKLIILDVDGVLTNGKKSYDLDGKVISKEFYDKDFSALNKLRHKYKIIFVSGDDRVNKALFNGRRYDFIHEYKDKWKVVQRLLRERGINDLDKVLYVGDDWPDLKCFENLSLTMCPSNAIEPIRKLATVVLPVCGGEGVIVELLYLLESN